MEIKKVKLHLNEEKYQILPKRSSKEPRYIFYLKNDSIIKSESYITFKASGLRVVFKMGKDGKHSSKNGKWVNVDFIFYINKNEAMLTKKGGYYKKTRKKINQRLIEKLKPFIVLKKHVNELPFYNFLKKNESFKKLQQALLFLEKK
jgi:hypothetical protein